MNQYAALSHHHSLHPFCFLVILRFSFRKERHHFEIQTGSTTAFSGPFVNYYGKVSAQLVVSITSLAF
jgi:hypothetical protein